MLVFITAALLFCVSADGAINQVAKPVAAKEQSRIGQIQIFGNTITRDSAIRPSLNFAPGQLFRPLDLRIAEKELNRLGIVRATVSVEAGGGDEPFVNIIVMIVEIPTLTCRFERGITSMGDPIIRSVIEERNFDPSRWPVSWDDIKEGRAFRGGGQKIRFELMQFNLVHGWLTFFPQLESIKAPPREHVRNR